MPRSVIPGHLLRIFIALLILIAPTASLAAHPAQTVSGPGPFTVTTIYSNIPGHPTANVPGIPGLQFQPGTGNTHFDRVFGSPNGNWILTALTNSGSTLNDEIILVNNVVRAREGSPWPGGTENIGPIDTQVGINNAGQWVFATNTDAATTIDEVIVMISATDVVTVVAREGDPVPGLAGASWGITLDSASVTSNGTVSLRGTGLTGLTAATNAAIVLGNNVIAQRGVTIPTGATDAWEFFDLESYWVTPDGLTYLAQGDLLGATTSDDVVVVNGTVVVREGFVLPGTTFAEPVALNGIINVHLAPNGDWYVRGGNATTLQDWVFSNNGLLAVRDQPIFPGSTENWSDTEFAACFFLHVGNSNGDFVIGGVTNGPTLTNGVLVYNNQVVIAREGDPVDLDNNGLFDDDAFFNTFGNDDGYLSDAGIFYFVANIKNASNVATGQGFFSIDLGSTPNTVPTLEGLAVNSPINENETATLTGNINDPDQGDTFDLMVDWGDGTVISYSYAAATPFTETHTYLDDDPTGTPSDVYTITLTIMDSAGGSSSDSLNITVNNVPPTVVAGPDQAQVVNNPVNFAGSFTDPGTLDTHTYSWDFGDGNIVTGVLTTSHTYTTTGVFTAILTVTDDDGGVGSDSLQVTISTPTDVTMTAISGHSTPLAAVSLISLLALLAAALFFRFRRVSEQ